METTSETLNGETAKQVIQIIQPGAADTDETFSTPLYINFKELLTTEVRYQAHIAHQCDIEELALRRLLESDCVQAITAPQGFSVRLRHNTDVLCKINKTLFPVRALAETTIIVHGLTINVKRQGAGLVAAPTPYLWNNLPILLSTKFSRQNPMLGPLFDPWPAESIHPYNAQLVHTLQIQINAMIQYHCSALGVCYALQNRPPPAHPAHLKAKSMATQLECSPKIAQFIHRLATEYNIKVQHLSLLNQLNLLSCWGSLHILYYVLTNNDQVETYVNALRSSQKTIHNAKLRNSTLNDNYVAQQTSLYILHNRWGPATDLTHLSPGERDDVKTHTEEHKSYIAAYKANTCVHINLVNNIRKCAAADSIKHLQTLQQYMQEERGDDWIMCNKCNFPLICPHVRLLIKLQVQERSLDFIRSRMTPYIQPTIGNNFFTYYCRICSEKISTDYDTTTLASQLGVYGCLYNNIKKQLWVEAIKLAPIVHFPFPVTAHVFASIAADECFEILVTACAPTSDTISADLHLDIIIFIYVFIYNLIQSSITAGRIISFNKYKYKKASLYIPKLLNYLLEHHTNIIKKANAPSVDKITGRFTQLGTLFLKNKGLRYIATQQYETAHLLNIIDNNPTYAYGTLIAKLCKRLPLERALTPSEAQQELETVLGDKIEKLLYSDTPFKHLIAPPEAQNCLSLHDAMKRDQTQECSFHDIGRALFYEAYKLFWTYTTAGPGPVYSKTLKTIRHLEKEFWKSKELQTCQRTYKFKFSQRYELSYPLWGGCAGLRSNIQPLPIGYLYDEQGHPHSWTNISPNATSYIYQVGSTVVEMTIPQIQHYIQTPHPDHRVLKDMRCSVCNTLLSQCSALDETIIMSALRLQQQYKTFFSFFEYRCPEGGYHTYENSVCSKCKYHTIWKPAEQKKYYKKYFSIYELMHEPEVTKYSFPKPAQPPKTSFDATTWQYDFSLIVKAATITNTPVAAYERIGATEGGDYDKILNTPRGAPVTRWSDARLLAADRVVRSFLSMYNTLRYGYQFATPPWRHLLITNHVPEYEYTNLPHLLPILTNNYYINREAIIRTRPPEDVFLFTIEALCRMIVDLYECASVSYINILKKHFLIEVTQKIFLGQRVFSKNGHFDFKIFGQGLKPLKI